MKKIFLAVSALLIINADTISQSKILSENLVTQNGLKLSKDTLSKGIWVVLITTYECGYCMRDIAYNNTFLETYKENINAIALYDHDSTKLLEIEKKTGKKLNWTKITNAYSIQKKYWKHGGVYPQVHIYNNGKLYTTVTGSSDELKQKVVKLISKLTKSNS